MSPETILNIAKDIENEIIENRRWLHSHAETGFELTETYNFVWNKLKDMGYAPEKCGKCGIVCKLGKSEGKTILVRADMDALPMKEETSLDFACKNGNMHSCGHDTHTAMLLGAAKILRSFEDDLQGTVKLMFQPAEETLEGASDMIYNGLLADDTIKAAFMIHSITGVPLPKGALIVASEGVSSPAADYFKITVSGKSCHGSTPQNGIDAISAASHIVIALHEISARELGVNDKAVLTIGKMRGGSGGNVIADVCEMEGTIRAYDEKIRMYIKKRIAEIASSVATAMRAKADISFGGGCPTLINNKDLSEFMINASKELLGDNHVLSTAELGSSTSGGSEDFSYISHQIPSVMLSLVAGNTEDGYRYPQHHPKAIFSEDILYRGAAIYAYNAIKWLHDN